MAALAALIAHGGVAGAVVEALVALAVLGVILAVWLRERRSSKADDEPSRLTDLEPPSL